MSIFFTFFSAYLLAQGKKFSNDFSDDTTTEYHATPNKLVTIPQNHRYVWPHLGGRPATAYQFSTRTTPSPLPRVSDKEARWLYYAGLPSKLVLAKEVWSGYASGPVGALYGERPCERATS